jgi:hypothetical protein
VTALGSRGVGCISKAGRKHVEGNSVYTITASVLRSPDIYLSPKGGFRCFISSKLGRFASYERIENSLEDAWLQEVCTRRATYLIELDKFQL